MLANPGCQIRPDLSELAVLSQIGVLQPSSVFEDPIVSSTTHPVCRKFRGVGPGPRLVTKRGDVDEARVKLGMADMAAADKGSIQPAQQQ
jgi:hypothetical protein